MGSIPREHTYKNIYNLNKSLWIKASAKCINVKCNIKQSMRLSQCILCNEACECACNSLQPFRTFRILFYGRFEWCMCVWGIGSKQNTGVSKANSASAHIWLKTELRIIGERIAMIMIYWVSFTNNCTQVSGILKTSYRISHVKIILAYISKASLICIYQGL